jgi:pilus assembly protein Flp/PilA
MQHLRGVLERFIRDEDGVTMLEYTILLGIITVAVIAAVVAVGGWVGARWGSLRGALGV